MDLKGMKLFDMFNKKMIYVSQRTDVLAQNVAQADTPDYVPRDLAPLDFEKTLRQQFVRLAPKRTTVLHLKGTLPTDPKFRAMETDKAYETAPDGNEVNLEEQMMKVSDNAIQHRTVTNLYKKYGRMLKTAMSKGMG